MRSSFFSRPPLRLTWYVPNRITFAPASRFSWMCARLQVLDLQLEPLGETERGVATFDLARQFLLQCEHALRTRQRIERHAPLDDLDEIVGVDVAQPRERQRQAVLVDALRRVVGRIA